MCVGRTAPMHVRQGEHPLPTQLMGEQPHVLCIVCGEQPSHYSDSCFISEQPYVSIAIVWGEQPPHNILASSLSLPKLGRASSPYLDSSWANNPMFCSSV